MNLRWPEFEIILFSQGIATDLVRPHRAWVMDQYWQINSDNGRNSDYSPDWACGQQGMDQITTVPQAMARLKTHQPNTTAWRAVLLKAYYLLGGRCDDDRVA